MASRKYAIHIGAPNDTNGNPRRGWVVYDADGDYLGSVDEEYRGGAGLDLEYPNAIVLASVPVSATVYRAWIHKAEGRLR